MANKQREAFWLTFRMIAPTIVLAAGLLLLGGVSAWYLYRLQREASDLLATSVSKVSAAEELELISYRIRGQLNEFLYTGDRDQLAGISTLYENAATWIRKAEQLANNPREKELITKIDEGYGLFLVEYRKINREPPPEESREAIEYLIGQVTDEEILRPAADYRDLTLKAMTAASARGQLIADRMGLTLLLLGMCGAVAGLVAGLGIARGVRRSMVQLTVPIRDVTGKLEEVVGPINVYSDPSFKGLENALKQLSEKVGAVVERLHESHRAAARAEHLAAIGRLAAGLAHELRNPLTSIKVLVQAAAEEGETAGLQGRDLAVVEEEIDRLDRSIQTFLDFARPAKPQKRPFQPREVLEKTIELVSRQAAQLGISIERRFSSADLPLEADERQIRQVLLNLLLNAIDASPRGAAIIAGMDYEPPIAPGSGTEGSAAAAEYVRIEIADSGPGLPAELGDRIFEPFVSTKETGTGLGLAICKRIVEDHGGWIRATNRPEGGALFALCLPIGGNPKPEGCPDELPKATVL